MLAMHSDASYMSKPRAHSRAGGHFFLSTQDMFPLNNGAVHNTAQVIKAIMSLAAKAELGALFLIAKQAAPMQHMLIKMGHLQHLTPIQTDNLAAFGIVTNKIIPKATKEMDMQFHWLCNHKQQQQFHSYMQPGEMNFIDYWTKDMLLPTTSTCNRPANVFCSYPNA